MGAEVKGCQLAIRPLPHPSGGRPGLHPDQGGGQHELQDQALHAPDCSQDGMHAPRRGETTCRFPGRTSVLYSP